MLLNGNRNFKIRLLMKVMETIRSAIYFLKTTVKLNLLNRSH